MARFFVDKVLSKEFIINGSDAAHISKSLRMQIGDKITICDNNSTDHLCIIKKINKTEILLKVVKSFPCPNEPSIDVTLYQALPKSDKMDLIIQKTVELGVNRIVPVLTSRCVSRPDKKSFDKKLLRWQKISEEAAKQSRRGQIPKIKPLLDLENAAKDACRNQCSMVFYELHGKKIGDIIENTPKTISLFIGPEGGFSLDEISMLSSYNVVSATLGRRILRTETAPIAALSVIMYETGNLQI